MLGVARDASADELLIPFSWLLTPWKSDAGSASLQHKQREAARGDLVSLRVIVRRLSSADTCSTYSEFSYC